MKKLLIPLLLYLPAFAANVYTPRKFIEYPSVEVHLSKDLADIVDIKNLNIFAKQINKMPVEIPRVSFHQSDETLEKENRISKAISLNVESANTGIQQIFVAYKHGEDYGLGNTIAKVYASNAGLIVLNDIRLRNRQAYDYHPGFTTNAIIHEIVHIYGLNHADGLGTIVKNIPVMSLGKSAPLGMSFDDKAGLLENYNVVSKKLREVCIETNGKVVAIINKKNKELSQSKNVKDGKVLFTHVVKGKYYVLVDGVEIERIMVK